LREKRKFALFIGLVLFHLVLISIQVPKGDEPTYFERAMFSVFSPVEHAAVSVIGRFRSLWSDYVYLRNVEVQNQKMRDELFFLHEENVVLRGKLVRFEGERGMRELLGGVSRSILAASVIAFDPSRVYKSVVLNRGASDGVKKDMVVLDRRGRLIGRVIGVVAARQSKVQLITDEESGVGVLTARTRVVGVLGGDAGGHCLLKYVLKTAGAIEPEEEVVTSGFDGVYPAGIPVGTVLSVIEDPSLFRKIVVTPFFDFSDLDQVAVFKADLRDPR
jgi:rod shape-determining protein MreC